jgi:hypothetical protein
MDIKFLSEAYPSNDLTDGQYLYRSLGSFWTHIFQDKKALQGYTLGQAEELTQSYLKLAEIINTYSVKNIPLYAKEKWKPLLIKKSAANKASFKFENTGAVFGVQPQDDPYYANRLFRFGFPKETGDSVYGYEVGNNIKDFGLLANRVIAPSLVLLPGVDFTLSNGVLYFNKDIFNSDYLPKSKILGEFGSVVQFKDASGELVDDELIILWMHDASIDVDYLYKNFGILFDFRLSTSQNYKDILKSFMQLAVDGPSIEAITLALSAFCGLPTVIEPTETVEDIFTNSNHTHRIVVTDKQVYRLPIDQELARNVQVGKKIYLGQCIGAGLEVIDAVITPDWWINSIKTKKLGLPAHLFAANVKHQLFFESDVTLITKTNGDIYFPVTGNPRDVQAFQAYINEPANKTIISEKLGLLDDNSTGLYSSPLDFVFSNFLKNNTLLIKLSFHSDKQLKLFFDLLPTIKDYLPAHVCLLTYVTLTLQSEILGGLNNALSISDYPNEYFSMDGSDPFTGSRPGSVEESVYYKDYANRLFCISVGPYRDGKPLHDEDNLDTIMIDNGTTKNTSFSGIKSGLLRTEIPEIVIPPGDAARGPSTREVQTILLIDF